MNITNSTLDKHMIECNLICQLGLLIAYIILSLIVFISCTKPKQRTCCNYCYCMFFFWLICASGNADCSGDTSNIDVNTQPTNIDVNTQPTNIELPERTV